MSVRERLADEGGTAVIEFVWLAILLLVPLMYLEAGETQHEDRKSVV